MIIRKRLLIPAIAAASILLYIPGTALAASTTTAHGVTAVATSTAPGTSAPQASRTIRLPDHTTITLPKAYDKMTPAQLATHGIKPGLHGLHAVTAESTARIGMRPMNASGWNQNVEIIIKSVNGKGLTVNDWETVADPGAYVCTWANYWLQPGSILWAQSNEVCGDAFYSNANNTLPFKFNNGEQLCNSWISVAGYPCETVHS